jgi:hypothetical protein
MNNQEGAPKKKYSKFFIAFLAVIFLVIIGWRIGPLLYQKWGEMRVERLAENLRRLEKEGYEAAMADTYGGKTPQETLQMYIEAVEKGDYELASKYFVIGKQEEQLKSMKISAENSTTEEIKQFLDARRNLLKNSGKYFKNGTYFSFDDRILVQMMLYPNGTWKIIEI